MSNKIFEDSVQTIKNAVPDDGIAIINKYIDEIKSTIDFKKIDYCIDNYINAEIDYQTTGERGIGRISDTIPRFGSYFRKQICKLSSENLNEIKDNIKQILYIGYLTHIFLHEEVFKNSNSISSQELFEKWIPNIYLINVGDIPSDINKSLFGYTNETLMNLKKILIKNGLVGGGIFSSDKTDMILTYYPIAGYGLRSSEKH
ncbi:MAG: hypothetical protein JJE53_03735 [Candidatus Pacebacteria bacterium]|nr:hypothetical protein [Candidatus Paceibacterota bacterium]